MISVLSPGHLTNWTPLSGREPAPGAASATRSLNFMRALQPATFWRGSNLFMSRPKSFFLTGATGFLGSHLTARLLADGNQVKVLARSSRNVSAEERVRQVLRDVGVTRFENLSVFEGDISLPGLGLSDSARREITSSVQEVWHCAASLSFQEEDRAEIFKMNIDGTVHLLDLVKAVPGSRLHHVSTAYIAGNRADLALESEIDVGQTFKNPYEASKCRAELIVS